MNNNFAKALSYIQDSCSDIEYMYEELMDENNELRLDKERLEKDLDVAQDYIHDLEQDISMLQEKLEMIDND